MDQEIDLRPVLQALISWWRLIVGIVALLLALAVVSALLQPRPARARGDILVIPSTSQLTLDPRFAERDATIVTNPLTQRQALVDLASSSALESRVMSELGMPAGGFGGLLANIDVSASSDLVRITATAPTDAEALRLAEVWTRSYASLVNDLYSGSGPALDRIESQAVEAQQRFDEVQSSLNAFYATGDLVRAAQQVQRLTGLLEGGVEAQVGLYTQYLTRTQELSLILEDARTLQAQYEANGAADLSAGIAALAVRARVAGGDQLPLQLSFDSAESFAQGQAAAADLERFVTVLEGERDRMVAQADRLAQELASGNSVAVGLAPDVRARYEEELAVAQGALARAEGQEELLIQRRDVALSSLEVLQAKSDELQIDQAVPQVTVRLVNVTPLPPRSPVMAVAINLVTALVGGIVLGSGLAMLLELVRQRRRTRAAVAQTGGEPTAGHTPASD